MKKLIVFLVVAFVGFTAQAQEKEVKKNKNARYDIEVNGNCDMCKKRIEKAAYSVKGVKSAQWHSDHQDMHLIIDESKTSIEEVHKAVAKAGHDTDKAKADDKVYEELHGCCMYERKK
ncbi:MAG: cation transporter [Flavobacteriaceae bacterium]